METVGVISEYNPFHKGHRYQFDEIKRLTNNADIVCIMSPNFVQRGEPALFDKYTRGECAIEEGADLAVAMPLAHALLSAEGFAECGVNLAKRLGVTTLAFGVENDNILLSQEIAKLLSDESFDSVMKAETEKSPSLPYAKHRENAVRSILGEEAADFIKTPNNILAIEYLKAILKFAPEIKPLPIQRVGNGYNDESDKGEFLSATSLRKMSKNGDVFLSHIPEGARAVLERAHTFDFKKYESFLYSVIISKSREELTKYTGNLELASIIRKNSEKWVCYDEFRKALSRRKYPETRINRALTNLLLDTEHDEYMHKDPEYMTLLATNDRGRKIVANSRHGEGAVIMSRGADYKKYSFPSIEKEIFADSIYARHISQPEDGGYFLKKKPYTKEELK